MDNPTKPSLVPLPVQAAFCLILLVLAMVLATATIVVAAAQSSRLEDARRGHGGSFGDPGKHSSKTLEPRPIPDVIPSPIPLEVSP